jgi:hypothetical protein
MHAVRESQMFKHAKRMKYWLENRVWRSLGPGLITGAADDDPSGIATYSMAGARFGLKEQRAGSFESVGSTSAPERCSRIW